MKIRRILISVFGLMFLLLVVWLQIAYWTSTNDCDLATGVPEHPMKAIRCCEYGSPDVLRLDDVEKPAPNDNQVLVRAAALNPLNLTMHTPMAIRLMIGRAQTEGDAPGCGLRGNSRSCG